MSTPQSHFGGVVFWYNNRVKRPEYSKHLQMYAWASRQCFGKSVTDFGCGTGHGLQIISHFAKSVIGWDISPHDTKIAGKLQYACPSQILLVDAEGAPDFTLPGTDVSLAFEFLEHIKDPKTFVGRVKNTTLICSVPHDYPHELHLTMYRSLDDFKALLSPHYTNIKYFFWKDGNIEPVGSVLPQMGTPERYVAICTPTINIHEQAD